MKNKRNAGITLLEVVVAVGILAIMVGPVMGLFFTATRVNAQASKITIASFAAQMRMEELVGLNEETLRDVDHFNDLVADTITSVSDNEDYNGYVVTATVQFKYNGSSSLALATVIASEEVGSPALCTYEDILRVN